MTSAPQWRPRGAKKNRKLLRSLHLERSGCALIDETCSGKIELHHVLGGAYGREDHVSNLVRVCSFHHALITGNDVGIRVELGEYIRVNRQDIIAYVQERMGFEAGSDWLRRRLFISE